MRAGEREGGRKRVKKIIREINSNYIAKDARKMGEFNVRRRRLDFYSI